MKGQEGRKCCGKSVCKTKREKGGEGESQGNEGGGTRMLGGLRKDS